MSETRTAGAGASSVAGWSCAVVYGLGASGRAAALLLLERGVAVRGFDDREISTADLGELGAMDGLELAPAIVDPAELLSEVDALVLSPGIALDRPLVKKASELGVPAIGEIELAWSVLQAESQGEVIAITGSNGKSTTTALTGALLRAAGRPTEVCGNIGEPLSSRVPGPPGRTFVVEVSSFQLESVSQFRPRLATLLNVSADHLDRHGDLASYARIKARIFARQAAGDVAVLNGDDSGSYEAPIPPGVRRRYFSRLGPVTDGCYLRDDRVVEISPGATERELFGIGDLPLEGPHNLENAMAAALMADSVGVPAAGMPASLAAFRGLPHRLERIRERGGVVWFDDSKGTNVAATQRSLEGFRDRSVHLILGGRSKNADLSSLRSVVERKARMLYLVGESAMGFEAVLSALVPCVMAETVERAVSLAAEAATAGEVVLLSPACASFDQFRNFAERGDVFRRLVHELSSVAGPPPEGERDG